MTARAAGDHPQRDGAALRVVPAAADEQDRRAGRDTVLGLLDDVLVATWNTSLLPEPYHDLGVWPDPMLRRCSCRSSRAVRGRPSTSVDVRRDPA